MVENLLSFALSFLVVYILLPSIIESLKSKKIVVRDMYKKSETYVPTNGSIILIFSVLVIHTFLPLLLKLAIRLKLLTQDNVQANFDILDMSLLLVVSLFIILGFVDELIDLGWFTKILLPLLFTFPIVMFFEPQEIYITENLSYNLSKDLIFDISLSDIFIVFVIPIYIMVIANLVNMHSGFNGLQNGLTIILLSTLILKVFLMGERTVLMTPFSFLGALFAFWIYNKFPATILEGNIGPLMYGSLIGGLIVLHELYIFGIFIFIPHIVDFLMLIYVKTTNIGFTKFGGLKENGNIKAPNPYKMKFLLPYFFELNERQVVFYNYLLTLFFCVTGIILFS